MLVRRDVVVPHYFEVQLNSCPLQYLQPIIDIKRCAGVQGNDDVAFWQFFDVIRKELVARTVG